VMRQLYREAYKKGTGFTAAQWWSAVSQAAGGRSFADFAARYIEGREPLPYAAVLPLAAMRAVLDTTHNLTLGVQLDTDSAGVLTVASVRPGSAAAEAGVMPGDVLLAVGAFTSKDRDFLAIARDHYATAGEPLTLTVRRGARTLELRTHTQVQVRIEAHVVPDPGASAKAKGILAAMLKAP
jgi:predicted metalloprotease with PDZ domain